MWRRRGIESGVEAIDASTELFSILNCGEHDIEGVARNITDVLEDKDSYVTYDHINHWVYTAYRRSHNLPCSLHLGAIEHIDRLIIGDISGGLGLPRQAAKSSRLLIQSRN